MTALYRTYRPQTFAEIRGQDQIVKALRQSIIQNRMAHAYLFYGPRGTGKTTMARIFAKRLFCLGAEKNNPEPCTTCDLCRASQEGSNSDIHEIDAASHRGIDDIRAVRENTTFRPTRGNYTVYIIDEVHMLTNEAFAALLKTLEEPPAHVVFILATTEFHKVPATIASRSQVYRFRRASHEEMRQRLEWILEREQRTVAAETLDFIISRSDGCYRDAESLLGQLLTAHEGTVSKNEAVDFLGLPPPQLVNDFLVALVRGESQPALAAADTIFTQGYDPEQFLREALLEARSAALLLVRGDQSLPPAAKEKNAEQKLPEIIRMLLMALQDLAFVPQPMLAVQLAILTLCTRKGNGDTHQVQPTPVAVAAPVTSPGLEAIKRVWPEVIQKMRETNPVASTFLRAVEPLSLEQSSLTLRAKYPLHKNFFAKREHAAMVERILAELTGTTVTVTCTLIENGSAEGNSNLLETVKEVFGDKIKT